MKPVKFVKADKPKITIGVHIGTLIQLIDQGTQPDYLYEGKMCAGKPKILLNFEFPNLKDGEGKPVNFLFDAILSERIGQPLNLYANALLGGTEEVAKQLEEELNLQSLLGKSAQLQIGKTTPKNPESEGNPKIITMMALSAGTPQPVPSVVPTLFDLDKPDMALFEAFLPWVQNKIKAAKEAPLAIKNFTGVKTEVPIGNNTLAPKPTINITQENF